MKNLSLIIALLLMIGSQAGAECGNLCDRDWWATATEADVQAELDGGADVMARNDYGITPLHFAGTAENIQVLLTAGADVTARDEFGETPLHYAASCYVCKPERITTLLAAGADPKAKNKLGKTPWDLAKENETLKGSKDYWALNDARFK